MSKEILFDFLAFLDAPSFGEIITILLVGLIVFGGKLPDVARNLGQAAAKLKRNISNLKDELNNELANPLEPPKNPPIKREENKRIGEQDS